MSCRLKSSVCLAVEATHRRETAARQLAAKAHDDVARRPVHDSSRFYHAPRVRAIRRGHGQITGRSTPRRSAAPPGVWRPAAPSSDRSPSTGGPHPAAAARGRTTRASLVVVMRSPSRRLPYRKRPADHGRRRGVVLVRW